MTQPTLPLIIYHDNCADGFGAAWAAYKKFGANGAEYLPMGYNDPRVKLKQIKFANPVLDFPVPIAARDVYILDFSFSPEIIDAMLHHANSVTWIDHHKTAFEAFNFNATEPVHLNDFELNLEIILDPNKSGCVLAWEYFHGSDYLPVLLLLIQDRDLWHWRCIGTRDLATGLRSEPFSFNWFDFADKKLDSVIKSGKAMNKLFDQQLADITKKHMIVMINGRLGHLGRAVNCTPQFSSEAGNILAKESGTFGMTWCVGSDGMVNVSLRSIGEYDVSAIAKTFGGGGHKNAAGFQVSFDRLYFEDNILKFKL